MQAHLFQFKKNLLRGFDIKKNLHTFVAETEINNLLFFTFHYKLIYAIWQRI